MDCERFDKTTMDLLYAELDELSEAAALRHLHHCTRCRDIWGHLRTTRELANLPLEEPPDDLFESILLAEKTAHNSLTIGERFSRTISILADYAMRPQVAMAAILLLMIGSSLIFVRSGPLGRDQVSVTEIGTPESDVPDTIPARALVFKKSEDSSLQERKEKSAQAEVRETAPEKAQADELGSRRAYMDAMSAYQDGRYAEAERLFSEVASSSSDQAASAALHEGHAARNGSGCGRAAALYDAIASQHSGSTVGSEASWHAASCYRALGQVRRARAHYQTLTQRGAYASRAKQALDELSSQISGATVDKNAASARPSSSSSRLASSKTKASRKKTSAKTATTLAPADSETPAPSSAKDINTAPEGDETPPSGEIVE